MCALSLFRALQCYAPCAGFWISSKQMAAAHAHAATEQTRISSSVRDGKCAITAHDGRRGYSQARGGWQHTSDRHASGAAASCSQAGRLSQPNPSCRACSCRGREKRHLEQRTCSVNAPSPLTTDGEVAAKHVAAPRTRRRTTPAVQLRLVLKPYASPNLTLAAARMLMPRQRKAASRAAYVAQ